jgi:hypothetical protein
MNPKGIRPQLLNEGTGLLLPCGYLSSQREHSSTKRKMKREVLSEGKETVEREIQV